MEKREIYTSIRKTIMIMVSYVLIAVAVSALVFTQTDLLILKVFVVLIDVVIAAAFVFTFRKMLNRKPLFVFDENGVTDYSKPEDIITTLEARMKCGVGKCGRCNIGGRYICLDGPVFTEAELATIPRDL